MKGTLFISKAEIPAGIKLSGKITGVAYNSNIVRKNKPVKELRFEGLNAEEVDALRIDSRLDWEGETGDDYLVTVWLDEAPAGVVIPTRNKSAIRGQATNAATDYFVVKDYEFTELI